MEPEQKKWLPFPPLPAWLKLDLDQSLPEALIREVEKTGADKEGDVDQGDDDNRYKERRHLEFRNHRVVIPRFEMVFGNETEYGLTIRDVSLPAKRKRPDNENYLAGFCERYIFGMLLRYVAEHYERQCYDDRRKEDIKNDEPFSYKPDIDFKLYDMGLWLPNGARAYVDMAHFETATSEQNDPHYLCAQEKALLRVLDEARQKIETQFPDYKIRIDKNNSDRKGSSWACHENFLLRRPFFEILMESNEWSEAWMSFLATSIIYTGAGKVGVDLCYSMDPSHYRFLEEKSECGCNFQISQRADFVWTKFYLETITNRALINTRDEPHADKNFFGRLHVIMDDSTMSDWSTFLKFGTKALVLHMLQAQHQIERDALEKTYEWKKFILTDPITALHEISCDLEFDGKYELSSGAQAGAIEIQKAWLRCVKNFYFEFAPRHRIIPYWIKDVIVRWGKILELLEQKSPELNTKLDWCIKKTLIEGLQKKAQARGKTVSWKDEKIKLIDLAFADISENGLFNQWAACGKVESFIPEDLIKEADKNAPICSRGWLRGNFIKAWGRYISYIDWYKICILIRIRNQEFLARIELNPLIESAPALFERQSYEEFSLNLAYMIFQHSAISL